MVGKGPTFLPQTCLRSPLFCHGQICGEKDSGSVPGGQSASECGHGLSCSHVHHTRDLGRQRSKILRPQSHTLWLPVLSQGRDLL